jgi:predicted GIY-YIG superfamily endonuclease
MNDETFVYRLFDAEGALIYIGMSDDVARRVHDHALRKPWGSTIARCEKSLYPTRQEAARAECSAIYSEQPFFNVNHTGRPRLWTRVPAPELVPRTLRMSAAMSARLEEKARANHRTVPGEIRWAVTKYLSQLEDVA